jgi:drug/metabolite transporter (DMT)-like permease
MASNLSERSDHSQCIPDRPGASQAGWGSIRQDLHVITAETRVTSLRASGSVSGVNVVTAPDSGNSTAWLPAFLATAVIWGASFLFIKIGVEELPALWVGAVRVAIGALTLMVIMVFMRQRLPRDPKIWGHLVIPGVVGIAIPFSLFPLGEERVPSLVAGIWNATTALWVLPFAVFVFRTERFSTRAAVGLGLGFAGVLTVLGVWHTEGSALTGQLMCGAAAFCYGIAIPYIKRFTTGRGVSGISLAAGQSIVATIAIVPAALLSDGLPPAPSTVSWKVIGSVLALGIFGSGVAFALNMRVISLAGASTSAFVTYLVPLVSTTLGIVVLGESLTWNLPVGALIVLAGVAIAQGLLRLRPRRGPVVDKVEEPVRSPALAGGRPVE